MSRWSTDGDDDRALDGEAPNAECTDCGEPFVRAAIDLRTLCDACCDQRDAWASALERTLASAALRPDVVGVVDVAIVPVEPEAPLTPVIEVRLEQPAPRLHPFATLPTLFAVAATRAGKPIPKVQPSRRKQTA